MNEKTIFLAEDDIGVVDTITKYLASVGFQCDNARSKAEALKMIAAKEYDAYLIDLFLPNAPSHGEEADGVVLIRYATRINPLARCIVLTTHDEKNYLIQSMRAGACDWIDKGSGDSYREEVVGRVQAACTFYDLANGINGLRRHYVREAGCPLQTATLRCTRTTEIDDGWSRKNVFIVIPAKNYGDERKSIKAVLLRMGLNPIIEMESPHSGDMLCNICKLVRCSPYGIVDITTQRPNLAYELGLMHSLGRRVAILFNSEDGTRTPPSDLQGIKYLSYKQPSGGPKTAYLVKSLAEWVLANVPEANHSEAKKVIAGAEKDIAESV